MKQHLAQENEQLSRSCILCRKVIPGGGDGVNMKNHLLKAHFGCEEVVDLEDEEELEEPEMELVSKVSMR